MKCNGFLLLLCFVLVNTVFGQNKLTNKDIVLVNIGKLNRQQLAEVIQKVNAGKPKLVAMDVIFIEDSGDVDKPLVVALQNSRNLFLSSKVTPNTDTLGNETWSYATSHPKFLSSATSGISNFVDCGDLDYEERTISCSYVYSTINGNRLPSLTGAILTSFFPEEYSQLISMTNVPSALMWVYNVSDFKVLHPADFSVPKLEVNLKDKIVYFGYLDPERNDGMYTLKLGGGETKEVFHLIAQVNALITWDKVIHASPKKF